MAIATQAAGYWGVFVMNSAARTLSGAVIAALSMYLFDPVSGRRRRVQLRDQVSSGARKVGRGLDAAGRDLEHRVRGLAARTGSLFDSSVADDGVVAERVRATLGRVVSHPGALGVAVKYGHVTLSGSILAAEFAGALRAVESTRGVVGVDDRMAVYQDSRGISSLQGGRPRQQERFELFAENWSPAARLLAGAAGFGLIVSGRRRRGLMGLLTTAAGSTLLVRSTTKMPLRRVTGATGDTVHIQKTLHINAPVERVFDVLSRYEEFPNFMRNVHSVKIISPERSHWCVTGPAGSTVEWHAETLQVETNRLIAWRTLPGSTVRHSGSIRLEPHHGGTQLRIEMRYGPPAGVLGHGLARLLGVDPKTELDEDLMRLKSFLETGRQPHDCAARVHRNNAHRD
jgi:uncharacterized membrane protein/osmotically-inducible protein OsmY